MKKVALLLSLVLSVSAMDLDTILALVEENSPRLQNYELKIEQLRAKSKIRSILKDPTLSFGINDINTKRPFKRDLEAMQSHSISISQIFPITNRLELDSKLVLKGVDIARYQKEELKNILLANALNYSYKAILFKKKIALLKRYIKLLKKEKRLVESYYEVSKVGVEKIFEVESKIEQKRVELSNLNYLKEQVILELEKLTFAHIDSVNGRLKRVVPTLDIKSIVSSHPLILVLNEKLKKNELSIKVQQADMKPDIKVAVGYFQRDDFDDYTSLNFSMLIKRTKRQKLSIKMLRLESTAIKNEIKEQKEAIVQDIKALLRLLESSDSQIRRIEHKLLPLNKKQILALKAQLKSSDKNSLKLYTLLERGYELKLLSIDKMMRFFEGYSKLSYYRGER